MTTDLHRGDAHAQVRTRATRTLHRIVQPLAVGAISLGLLLSAGPSAAFATAPAAPRTAEQSESAEPENQGELQLTKLQVEKKTEPIGIDLDRPRFSWIIESGERGVEQQSYRVRLATDPAALDTEDAIWDSGVVASADSTGVEYSGPQLEPDTRYFWGVDVVTTAGAASGTSSFRSGLFDDEDWQGSRWVGNEPSIPGVADTLADASWIWTPESNPPYAPGEDRAFRRTIESPSGKQAETANILIAADDSYQLFVNGELVGEANGWSQSHSYTVPLVEKRNVIAVRAINNGASPAGLIAAVDVNYTDGTNDLVSTDTDWLGAKTIPEGFAEPGFDDSSWAPAVEQAPFGAGPWGTGLNAPVPSAPLLRKEFELPSGAKAATLYVAAGGYAKASINGEPVSEDVLSPGYTDYDDTVQYVGTDVTDLVEPGENAIGLELGRGFYGITNGGAWGWNTAPWHAEPTARAVLRVELADGTEQSIVTDESWTRHDGPTVFDNLYEGDFYDARLEQPGYDTDDFDDRGWQPVVVSDGPKGELVNQRQQPIRVTEELPATEIEEPVDGTYIVKFPRVLAGWVEVTAEGPAGTTIRMQAAEKKKDDGLLNFDNNVGMGADFQADRFTLAGTGAPETWEPSFTYHGFQYIQVTGWPEGREPRVEDFTAKAVHTDAEEWGSFESSEPIMNQVHRAVVDTLKNNIHGIPTDTPMFEKNGWTGDAAVGAEMFMMNLDTHELFAKWMRDIGENREEDGRPRVIAPSSGWGEWNENPPWHAAYVMIPWWLQQYGSDDRVLIEQYDGMKQYVDLEFAGSADGIVTAGLGDWVSPEASPGGGNAGEDTRVENTAYLYAMLTSMQRSADYLGKSADAERFAQNAAAVKAAFNETFLAEDGSHYRGANAERPESRYFQTHNVLPLAFGLTPDAATAKQVAASLVADIESRDHTLDTGVLGTKYLLPVLTEYGYADVAYELAVQTAYPSWGYMIENGGTSMWEHWSLDARSRGHYFLGTVDDWLYHSVAGIKPSEADGYRTIEMAPDTTERVDWAKAETQTPYGPVSTSWKSEDGNLRFSTHVPVGSTARIVLPAENAWAITEGGKHLEDVDGLESVERGEQGVTVVVGSGDYEFDVDAAAEPAGEILDRIDDLAAAIDAAHESGDIGDDAHHDLVLRIEQERELAREALLLAEEDRPVDSAEELAAVVTGLDEIAERLPDPDRSDAAHAVGEAEQRLRETLGSLISELLGLQISAEVAAEAYLPGEEGAIRASVENGGSETITEIAAALDGLGEDWQPAESIQLTSELPAGSAAEADLSFTVPGSVDPSEVPVRTGISYRFADATIELALDRTVVVGDAITISRLEVDPVSLEPGGSATVTATLENAGRLPVEGSLRYAVPDGWSQPPQSGKFIIPAGGSREISTTVFVPLGSDRVQRTVELSAGFLRGETELARASAELTVELSPVDEVAVGYDHIDLGDAPDEQAHDLSASPSSGTNTEAGLTRRYAGHLVDFSSFEFDMSIVPGEPFLLRSTETYDRAQTKRYKIYVDGTEAQLRQFAHQGEGGTETFEVLVPAELAASDRVRVKFETQDDHANFYDPSIADVWTLPLPKDAAPAVTLGTDPAAPAADGWYTAPSVEVALAAIDDRDPDPRIEYRIDGGEWTDSTGSFEVSGDGEHVVDARAEDEAGNLGEVVTAELRIDSAPPATEAVLGEEFEDGVAETAGTIRLEAVDETSGVASTSYRIDGGDWEEGAEVKLSTVGEHTIDYRSTDLAGNVEEERAVVASIVMEDRTAPSASAEISNAGENGWYRSGAAVTVTATDEESGIERIEYRLSGGEWQEYGDPVVLAEGVNAFEYRAVDRSGNVGAVGVIEAKVDASAPNVWGWRHSGERIIAVGSDALSGVAELQYSADGSGWVSGLGALTDRATLDGVRVRAQDRAGNVSAEIALGSGARPNRLEVVPGMQLLVEASGFAPGHEIRVELHSDPVLLATTNADDGGLLSVLAEVPDDVEEGQHELVLVDSEGGGSGDVVEIPTEISEIAKTGGAELRWAIGVAAGLLGVGFVTLLLVRRRR